MNTHVFPAGVQTSFGTALRLNGWAIVAILVAVLGRLILRQNDFEPVVRGLIALAPLIPSVLYVRGIGHWIRGLDELQRRIQYEAWFFATVGTILASTVLSVLTGSGALVGTRLAGGLGWEGTYCAALVLWMVGCLLANRRYA